MGVCAQTADAEPRVDFVIVAAADFVETHIAGIGYAVQKVNFPKAAFFVVVVVKLFGFARVVGIILVGKGDNAGGVNDLVQRNDVFVHRTRAGHYFESRAGGVFARNCMVEKRAQGVGGELFVVVSRNEPRHAVVFVGGVRNHCQNFARFGVHGNHHTRLGARFAVWHWVALVDVLNLFDEDVVGGVLQARVNGEHKVFAGDGRLGRL